jgi:hypothetical protein
MPPKIRPRLSRLCRVAVARTHETHETAETQNEDAYMPTFIQPHEESYVDLFSTHHLSELLGTSIPLHQTGHICPPIPHQQVCSNQSTNTPEACVHPQTPTPSFEGHGQPSTQPTQLQQPQQLLHGQVYTIGTYQVLYFIIISSILIDFISSILH